MAVGVPTVVLAAHMALYGRWLVDDAAITFAYARSLAEGAGPVLQAGTTPVEGWSNPTWLALLTVAIGFGLFDHGSWFGVPDLVMFPKALALVCGAGVAAGFHVVMREVVGDRWRAAVLAATAGSLVGLVPSYAVWLASGLENPLLTVTVIALTALLVRAEARGRLTTPTTAIVAGLLAAVAALTRPDGLVYMLGLPTVLLLLVRGGEPGRSVRAAGLSMLAFVVPVGTYLAWRWSTFGLLIPNTAVAKSQGLPGMTALNRPAELVSVAGWLLVCVVVAALGAASLRPGRHRPLVVMLVLLGLALGAYAVLEPDWMGLQRFATPVWALAALIGVVSMDRALRLATIRGRLVAVVLVGVALTVSGTSWWQTARTFREAPTVRLCGVAVAMGAGPNVLGDILGIRTGRLATPDIGGAALVSRYEIVDLVGLASGPIARFHADGDMAGLRNFVLDEVRPEMIEIHGAWTRATGLLEDPRMSERYLPIYMERPGSGYFVRRDLVPDPAVLDQATRFAEQVLQPRRESIGPRSSCGSLRPGSTDAVASD